MTTMPRDQRLIQLDAFWNAIGQSPGNFTDLSWAKFLVSNLLPVTIGNVIGGAVMVGVVYWFVYLQKPRSRSIT